MNPTNETILEALKQVNDPELHQSVVQLGMIQELHVEAGKVSFALVLTTPACPVREQFEADVRAAVVAVPGVTEVDIDVRADVPVTPELDEKGLSGVRNVIAIASGKGGVGKSTVSANLAVALAQAGAKVGLMDADVYGPNLPLMLGVHELPPMENGKIIPAENFGVKVVSMGFLVRAKEAVIWRGPMLHGVINKFLKEVDWGELDYLLIDLPPGTGDVQLSLTQTIPLTGAVIVTTPQDVALMDVARSIGMFEKVKVPMVGVVENMSGFVCPHCEEETPIFDQGGGERAAEQFEVPFLNAVPLYPKVREGGDTGHPVVLSEPESPPAKAFVQVAEQVAARVSVMAAQAQEQQESVWKI